MHFVDDIHTVAVPGRSRFNRFSHLTHVIHAVARSPVDLHDVEGRPPADLHATRAGKTQLGGRPLNTVERLR